MLSMLLRTRFYIPPLKPEHLVRSALIDRLQSTAGSELVLVSAPAGYGKTTLVSQWLHTHSQSFAWLIVDESQGLVEVFWQHIVSALQTLIPNVGEQSLTFLQSNDIDKAVIALLNDLDRLDVAQESDHAYTLIMDDFHKADNSDNCASLNLFLDHLPPCLRIVMTVRQDPSLSLARRRASGQLKEIQQQDLAFTSLECQSFLSKRLAKTVSYEMAQQLTQATEGWVTGIQLSSLLSVAEPTRSLNRDMADYLFEEVFSQQPSAVQDFLLSTCLVERFCPALSNLLCNIDNSYQIIKEIEAANLFIVALDNHRSWYRYHDLFRQFLLIQLENLAPQKQYKLHSNATNWFEQAGYYQLAFQHAIELKDWLNCEQLFTHIAEEKIDLGLEQSLIQFLQPLPAELAKTLAATYNLNKVKPQKNQLSSIPNLIEPLTKREAQVMSLVQQGLSNKEIAEQLFISLNTLKVHIRNLYGKMGVENRTQALLKMNN